MEPQPDPDVCVIHWKTHIDALPKALYDYFLKQQFVDVTLTCEGQSIKCHRIVLASCSTYFNRVLSENPGPTVIIHLSDMTYCDLLTLLTFMYCGEVTLRRNQFSGLCKAAESLKVKGLTRATAMGLKRMQNEDQEDLQRIEAKKKAMQMEKKSSAKNEGFTHPGWGWQKRAKQDEDSDK